MLFMFALLLLQLAAPKLILNDTIADVITQKTCEDYELANCARCFDMGSQYAPQIGATSLCYECAEGKYYWANGACTPLPDARSINGWGRTCAECGKGNFWSALSKHAFHAPSKPRTAPQGIAAMRTRISSAPPPSR